MVRVLRRNLSRSRGPAQVSDFTVNRFLGLVTSVADPKEVEKGTAIDAKNWLTGPYNDHIELRPGLKLLGTEVTGSGKITGMGVGIKADGTQVLFYTDNRGKAFYYNSDSDTRVEIGASILSAEPTEDVVIENYQGLSGSFIYLASPHTSFFKIAVANPGDAKDQLTQIQGKFKIDQNRLFLWDIRNERTGFTDKTGIQLSYIDKTLESLFSSVTAETIGTGDGSDKTFSGTLASVTGVRSCFRVMIAGATSALTNISAITQATLGVVTSAGHGLSVGDVVVFQEIVGMTQLNKRIASVVAVNGNDFTINIATNSFTAYSSGGKVGKAEFFTDDKNGVLSSNAGGTGTVNYTTGAVSTNFVVAPVNTAEIATEYLYEDSTSTGILDFTTDASAGHGKYFPQSDGGNLMAILSFASKQYGIHVQKTWVTEISRDDTEATNLPYYERIGIPYFLGAKATSEGVVLLDYSDKNNPRVRRLQFNQLSQVVPQELSDVLNLTPYEFDFVVVHEWGNFDIFLCQAKTLGVANEYNSLMFVRNKTSKAWDKLSGTFSRLANLSGKLIGGDSISNNIYEVFSGSDEDGSEIENYVTFGQMNLGAEGRKKYYRCEIDGYISSSQKLQILDSYDNGQFVEIGGEDDEVGNHTYAIEGSGSYVDLNNGTVVGSTTVGEDVIGSSGVPNAFHFHREFVVASDQFEYVQRKFVAMGIGAIQINYFKYKDIRYKGRKALPAYNN